jgi:hypothetical protein
MFVFAMFLSSHLTFGTEPFMASSSSREDFPACETAMLLLRCSKGCHAKGGDLWDEETLEGLQLLEKAAKEGDPQALSLMGLMRLMGKGFPKDLDQAEQLLKAAFSSWVCQDREHIALCWLGLHLKKGCGLDELPPELADFFANLEGYAKNVYQHWWDLAQKEQDGMQREEYTFVDFHPCQRDAWCVFDFLKLLSAVRKGIREPQAIDHSVDYSGLNLAEEGTFQVEFLSVEDAVTERPDTFAVLAREKKEKGHLHLGIRGTDTHFASVFEDLKTNLASVSKNFESSLMNPGSIHGGFGARAERLLPSIEAAFRALHRKYPETPTSVILSGHSQGGALVEALFPVLAKILLELWGQDLRIDVITFGAPRVAADLESKETIQNWMKGCGGTYWRFVLRNDPIPSLPLGRSTQGVVSDIQTKVLRGGALWTQFGIGFHHTSESHNETFIQASKRQWSILGFKTRDLWRTLVKRLRGHNLEVEEVSVDLAETGLKVEHARKAYQEHFFELRPVMMEDREEPASRLQGEIELYLRHRWSVVWGDS